MHWEMRSNQMKSSIYRIVNFFTNTKYTITIILNSILYHAGYIVKTFTIAKSIKSIDLSHRKKLDTFAIQYIQNDNYYFQTQ